MSYNHLTIFERKMLLKFQAQGLSYRAIALKLHWSPSTISREFHLRKQRFLCKNCGSTWGLKPILTKKNNTLSQPLRHNIIAMIYEGLPMTTIAKMVHCSPSSVGRIFNEFVQPRQRLAVLPKHLCFDEFRSVGPHMSFICCDAMDEHQAVAILPNRLTKTITNYFLNRYSLPERERVQSVVVDLNA